jgi:spore coat protein U-like protein
VSAGARLRRWARRASPILAAVAAAFFAATPGAAQSCSISTISGVSFGSYDALNANPLDQTGSISYQCSILYIGTVTIDLSTGGSGSYSPRRMQKAAATLQYNLYRDATRLLIWGNGTGGTSRYGPVIPILGLPQTLTIYGRIPAQQTSPVGNYTDTVVATINF